MRLAQNASSHFSYDAVSVLLVRLDGRSHPNMKTPSFVLVVIDMMNDSFERHEAFFGTDFEARLLPFQPMTLVVSCVNTHACVRTTVIDAYQRDFDVVVASDCIASYDDQHHEVTRRGSVGTSRISGTFTPDR